MKPATFLARLAKMTDAMEEFAARGEQIAVRLLEPVALEARDRVAEKTPRNDDPDSPSSSPDHAADYWKVKPRIGATPGFVIYNSSRRANQVIVTPKRFSSSPTPGRLAVGQPMTLLHILEYGAGPHKIVTRGIFYSKGKLRVAWPLRFFWEKIGAFVEMIEVNHPGTIGRKFPTGGIVWSSMVRPTVAEMAPAVTAVGFKMFSIARDALKGVRP